MFLARHGWVFISHTLKTSHLDVSAHLTVSESTSSPPCGFWMSDDNSLENYLVE
jgi:hypothetical protein